MRFIFGFETDRGRQHRLLEVLLRPNHRTNCGLQAVRARLDSKSTALAHFVFEGVSPNASPVLAGGEKWRVRPVGFDQWSPPEDRRQRSRVEGTEDATVDRDTGHLPVDCENRQDAG